MVKKKRVKKNSVKLAVALVIMVILILLGIFINGNVISGNAIWDSDDNKIGSGRALTLSQLRNGVRFSSPKQVFIWTNELEDNVATAEALASLSGLSLVVGLDGVDINKGWVGPGYGPAREKRNAYYYRQGRVLKELRPGRRYELRFASVPQTLRYSP